jgi:hypothetical protein
LKFLACGRRAAASPSSAAASSSPRCGSRRPHAGRPQQDGQKRPPGDQPFFCGGDHDEFDRWKKGLSALALADTKARVEKTLKLELDDEAFGRVYGHRSHPIEVRPGRRVAVRVISQFGEESTKVLTF